MSLILIAGVARNGTIGRDNALLWHLPEDLKHFRTATHGCPVIMGRKTWDSLPERFRPLPGRRNIVVTGDPHWVDAGALAADSLESALAAAGQSPKVFVIGGAALYALTLPFADELMLTEVDRDFDGDVSFPHWDRSEFVEVSRERHVAVEPNEFEFSFVTYRRRSAPEDQPGAAGDAVA